MAVLSKNLSLKFASIFYPYLIGDHEPGSVYVDLLIPGFPSGVMLGWWVPINDTGQEVVLSLVFQPRKLIKLVYCLHG